MDLGAYPYALATTLELEGGLADNPADPGGRTYRGVTQRRYDAYRLDKNKFLRDVALMEPDELASIYRAYWDAVEGDALPPALAIVAFDIAVNSGPGKANGWLQEGYGTPGLLTARRLEHYAGLSIWPTFSRGWTRRAARVLEAAERYSEA